MIRRATMDDMPDVARLHIEVRRICMPYLPELHAPAEVEAWFENHEFPSSEIWLAGDTALHGFCAWRDGWVEHLYVRPETHGRGIGSRLLRHAMRGASDAQLWVFQRNVAAIRFYHARGFTVVEKTDGGRNEERQPDARMSWRQVV